MKILHICSHIPHHSSHSGYDQLVRYMPSTQYKTGKIFRILQRRKAEKFKMFRAIHPNWYNFDNFCLEMELSARMNLVNGTIFHFLYGENNFRYLGAVPFRRNNRVVVSFHQPTDIFLDVIPDVRRVARADAVVVVGGSQYDFFRGCTRRDNVFVVPHGVDTEYFTPAAPRPKDGPLRCVTVGWWLRDVEMIKQIISTVGQIQNVNVEFHIVTFEWCQEFYRGLPGVHLYSGIPDDDLRALYRSSDLLLLPLKACTANNAVLEAMACGLPVLGTYVGSMGDYVKEDNAVLSLPGNPDPLIDAILDFARNPERLSPMGEASRRRAETFSWHAVADQMLECYKKIQ